MSKTKIKRAFYRSGQLQEEIHLLGRDLDGARRTWHPNGRLASEELYKNGRLHGLCRQWTEKGKLLGSFHMVQGTGIQREWFENGRLQFETSTVGGKFTGRTRVWLQDGTLVSEQYAIENRNVSRTAYIAAAAKNPDYPKYPANKGKIKFPDAEEIERREFQLQVNWLLGQRNQREAVAWLGAGTHRRSLGHFKFTQALQLAQKIYDAGAQHVAVVKIYEGDSGKQFSDALLVWLPPEKPARGAIRQLFAKLHKKLRAGVLPVRDYGADFLFVSFV